MPDSILQQTEQMRARYLKDQRDLFEQLAQGQTPKAMVIGCSDSRVVPEFLVGAQPGDLFIAHVVANVVPPPEISGNSVAASVEFAVDGLRVNHLIVCGHMDCGGIKALDNPELMQQHSALANWMRHATPALERAKREHLEGHARHRAIVEDNVLLQLEHLRRYPVVERAIGEGHLSLHGWVFDIERLEIRHFDEAAGRFVVSRPAEPDDAATLA